MLHPEPLCLSSLGDRFEAEIGREPHEAVTRKPMHDARRAVLVPVLAEQAGTPAVSVPCLDQPVAARAGESGGRLEGSAGMVVRGEASAISSITDRNVRPRRRRHRRRSDRPRTLRSVVSHRSRHRPRTAHRAVGCSSVPRRSRPGLDRSRPRTTRIRRLGSPMGSRRAHRAAHIRRCRKFRRRRRRHRNTPCESSKGHQRARGCTCRSRWRCTYPVAIPSDRRHTPGRESGPARA